MYNKLFSKIVRSSIWLEPDPIRIVWFTLMATMDETGFCEYASVANLAHIARVSLEDTKIAVEKFEGPDLDSSDPENDGRRIERVPGGWMVLNSEKHRNAGTRADVQEQTRERVRKFRERKRALQNTSKKAPAGSNTGNVVVTHETLHVTQANGKLTLSEADTYTEAEVQRRIGSFGTSPRPAVGDGAVPPGDPVVTVVTRNGDAVTRDIAPPIGWPPLSPPQNETAAELVYQAYPRKEGKGTALTAINHAHLRIQKGEPGLPAIADPRDAWIYLHRRVDTYARSPAGSRADKSKIPYPAKWFTDLRYLDDDSMWQHTGEIDDRPNRAQQRTNGNIAAGQAALAAIADREAADGFGRSEAGRDQFADARTLLLGASKIRA